MTITPHPRPHTRRHLQENSLYAWRAVPPSGDFVALGMICSTEPEEPSVEEMRSVPNNNFKILEKKTQ